MYKHNFTKKHDLYISSKGIKKYTLSKESYILLKEYKLPLE